MILYRKIFVELLIYKRIKKFSILLLKLLFFALIILICISYFNKKFIFIDNNSHIYNELNTMYKIDMQISELNHDNLYFEANKAKIDKEKIIFNYITGNNQGKTIFSKQAIYNNVDDTFTLLNRPLITIKEKK